ncbi:MAG: hypothetical protein RL597_160 [Pseudomonadota bacterium]
MPPLRVCHVIIGLGSGGAERMLSRLVAFQKRGESIEPIVISLTDAGVVGSLIIGSGVRLMTLGWKGIFGLPVLIFRLSRVIKSIDPDVVHTWMYHADLLGGVVARAVGVRSLIWGVRTTMLPEDAPWSTRFARWCCARLSRRLPDAITVNAVVARDFHAALGYDRHRMIVIHNGIDTDAALANVDSRNSLHSQWGVPSGALVVGMVGRDSPDKDPDNFVHAMSKIFTRMKNVVAVMVGKGFTAKNSRLGRLVDSTPYRSRFILVGEITNASSVMDAFDAFVLPSRTEAFPNVLGEAMASASVCVATNVGDVPEIIGDCGFVVPPENEQALADQVMRALELSPLERRELGARAQRRITEKFSMHRAGEAFEQLYADTYRARARSGVL